MTSEGCKAVVYNDLGVSVESAGRTCFSSI